MLSFPSSGSAFLLASIAKFRMALMTCLEVNRVCRLHVSETVSHMACMESAAKVQLAVEDEMALQGVTSSLKRSGSSLAQACLLARDALGRV